MEGLTANEYAYYRKFAALPKEEKVEFIQSLTDDEALRLRYTWEAWARDKQLEPRGEDWAIWLILAGRGCVAAGTKIYNPVTQESTPVEILAKVGKEIMVLSLTDEGVKPSVATAPFLKGVAPLYRVTLEDGKQIVTTLFHRFLTPSGWKMLSSLVSGDLIGYAPDLQESNSESSLPMLHADELHYSHTTQDYQDHCDPLHHLDDGQLPMEEGISLSSVPLQDDAERYIHFSWHKDDQASLREDTHLHHALAFLPSRKHYVQDVLLLPGEEYQALSCVHEHIPQRYQEHCQSLEWTCAEKQEGVVFPHQLEEVEYLSPTHSDDVCGIYRQPLNVSILSEEKPQIAHQFLLSKDQIHRERQSLQSVLPSLFHAVQCSEREGHALLSDERQHIVRLVEGYLFPVDTAPQESVEADGTFLSYVDYTSWGRITSIVFERNDLFYDLTVPIHANYLANGIWNHNSGKTRTGAEWIRKQAESGRYSRIALVGRTAADVRDVMLYGESGLISNSPSWFRPKHEGTRRRVVWPNGAIATTYSAEEPDSLRGPQHDCAWLDELCAWRTSDTYDQLMFGLRLGAHPRAIVTTTPRPTKEIKKLIKLRTTYTTRGNTYENRDNLADLFFDQIITRYEHSRLGRQELMAELLDDAEGALWKREAMIENYRVTKAPDLVRIVVGVDPATTSEEDSDETGIIVAGKGADGDLYILDDLSIRATPKEWATQAVSAYYKYNADRIIGEGNQGGDMVENTVRMIDKYVAYKKVHSKRGKYARAEPIAALYEQGRGHHVGMFAELEDQMCSWEQGMTESPDRIDALVHAATELLLEGYSGGGGMLSMKHLGVSEDEEFNPFW